MKVKEVFLILSGLGIFILLLILTSLSIEESFIIGFQIYLLLRFVNNVGNTICFFDFLCFYSVLDTLLMPVLGYALYDRTYTISRVWGWYMRVPASTYFAYMIPANIGFFVGVNLLMRKFDMAFYKSMIVKLEYHARDKGKVGLALTICGFIFSFLSSFISSLGFVAYLLSMLRYVGPVYIYFSNSPFRKRALYFSMVIFLIEAVRLGIFGEFLMYFTLLLIIVSIKFNFRFITKLSIFVFGVFLIFTLQSIKGAYRFIAWKGQEVEGLSLKNSSQLEVFGTLFYNRFSDMGKIFDRKAFYPIYSRLNQGQLISRAMDYVPRVAPYADGETIMLTFAGVLVPRFLWPDKPDVGGGVNLSRFLGIKKKLNYSMDIGPYGEAYGNFGPVYGILCMLVYGLLLSYLFKAVIKKGIKRPTLLLWTPVLFFSTLTMETNFLSTVNSFFKTAVFMYILFWLVKKFFKVSL